MTEGKNVKTVDGSEKNQYIADKMRLIAELKDRALFLANVYGGNIKVEIDVNPHVSSVKLSVKEFV